MAITASPALIPINYNFEREVYLSVDSFPRRRMDPLDPLASHRGWPPPLFGLIGWNEREPHS